MLFSKHCGSSTYCPLLFVFSLLSSSFLIPLHTATAAVAMWTIHVKGRLFHSGLPHKGINPIELASEAMAYIQRRFYEDFPPVSYINLVSLSLPPLPLPPLTLLVYVYMCSPLSTHQAVVNGCVCMLLWST